jgi:hypothetical protein
MAPDEARRIAVSQRRRFNQLVGAFDVPQPAEVMDRRGRSSLPPDCAVDRWFWTSGPGLAC